MTLLLLSLTVLAYAASLHIRKRWNVPLTTPVLTTTATIITVLLIARVPLAAYDRVQPVLCGFLTPASAALGVVIFKHRKLLAENSLAVCAGIAAGSTAAITSAVLLAHLLRLGPQLAGIVAVKSVTAAVAVQFAGLIHIDRTLTTVIVVATGVIGATIGPTVLGFARVRDPLARGVALGTVSHGIGTAQAVSESEMSGAASSLAMCIVALVMSLAVIPLVVLLHVSNRP